MKDAFIGVKNIPIVGTIRVGHIKEPHRFDALSSSKFFTFMERAIPADFGNERNNGIAIRPKSHLSRKYIRTGNIPGVETMHVINLEAAYSQGPFSIQAEYLNSGVHQNYEDISQTYNFKNYYAQVSYFITKEHRPFINSHTTFGSLTPKNNVFNGEKGAGAWEVALRYTNTDLNSKDIYGGQQEDIALGVNWYLNPATRIMLNQVWTHFPDEGNLNIFEIRFLNYPSIAMLM